MLNLTGNFSVAVELSGQSQIRNLGIYPNFLIGGDRLGGYKNSSTKLISDAWDVGV